MEAPVHPVEIAPAALEPLVLRERLPHAVWVPARTVCAEGQHAIPALADGERNGDVEISVEAVALVEAADLEQALASSGGAVALHRLGLSACDLVEVLEVARAKPPRTGLSDAALGEDLRQRAKEIAGDFDCAIEHEKHAAPRQTHQGL